MHDLINVDDLINVHKLSRLPVIGEIIYNKVVTGNLFQITEVIEANEHCLYAFKMKAIESTFDPTWSNQIWYWTSPFQAGLEPIFMEDMYKI